MKKNKITEKTMKEFAEWIELDYIYDSWTHEDYEDVTVYESRSANIICIRRDENGKVLEAWMEKKNLKQGLTNSPFHAIIKKTKRKR